MDCILDIHSAEYTCQIFHMFESLKQMYVMWLWYFVFLYQQAYMQVNMSVEIYQGWF